MSKTMLRSMASVACLLAGASVSFGAKKVVSPTTSASNEKVDIVATIVLDPDEVKQKLGADPGAGIVLLQVRVTPKTDESVQVSPDDFILLAHDDGERSKPFTPEDLAGNGAMVVSTKAGDSPKSKQSFGLGGMMVGGGSGSSPGNPKNTVTTARIDPKSKGNPELLKALQAKQFPTVDAKDEVAGLMYFPLDGKHKLKNLAVLYRGPAGRLDLEFEH